MRVIGPAQPLDWYNVYMHVAPAYPRNYFTTPSPPIDMNELQYTMAYEHGRYNLSSILFMYKATKNASFLQEFADQAATTFSSTYFQDGDNGANDGFLGWGMRRKSNPIYLREPFTQNSWHHIKIRVQDTTIQGTLRTRIQTTFNNQFFEGWLTNTYGFDGTIALLSGWSKSAYKNVIVRDLSSGQTYYDLNSSLGTFATDWNPMVSFVAGEESYTAPWVLDVPSGEIRCDATENTPGPFYYPWVPNPPNNPMPPNGTGTGKYAALVLMKSGSLSLRDYEIEFDLKVEKRNHQLAESGVNVRYHCPDPLYLTHGRGADITDPDPLWRVHGRNTQFAGRYNADWISVRIRPDILGYKVSAFTMGSNSFHNKWSVGAGHAFLHDDRFTMSQGNLYAETAEYDTKICAPILRFVETVYEEQLEQFYSTADLFLTSIQNNVFAKWYVNRLHDTESWIYGGGSPIDYGGWKRSGLTWQQASFGHARIYSTLAKIVQKNYTRWADATSANPCPYLPQPSELAGHIQTTFYEMAQVWKEGLWIENDLYQWSWLRDFGGEFQPLGRPDNLHTAETVHFALDCYDQGLYSEEDMQKIARAFTQRAWNGQSGQAVHLYVSINGGESGWPSGEFYDAMYNPDYFAPLSTINFKLWEIINDWWTRAEGEGPVNTANPRYYKNYRLIPSLLLYYVKYGTPKNFRVNSISGGGTYVALAWSNPSDYPVSAERPNGTGLRYFNIYKREYGQPWPATPYAQMSTAAHSFTDDELDPTKIHPPK